MSALRFEAWLAGLWVGVLACIGAMAAPAAFAVLPVPEAGRFVGRLFAQEAYLALAMAVALFVLERFRQREAVAAGTASVLSLNIVLVLGTLFCTVAGYFAIQPMMDAARAGQGPWSFGALHAISGSLFVLKAVLVAVIAWRLAPARLPPPPPVSPAAIS